MFRSVRSLAARIVASLLLGCSSQGPGNAHSPAPGLAMTPPASGGAQAPGTGGQGSLPGASGVGGTPAAALPGDGNAGNAATGGAAAVQPDAGDAGAAGSQADATVAPPQACAAMLAAAKDFLGSLDTDSLKSAARVPFEQHRNFAYEPQVADRPGVSLAMMSAAQREKALALLRSGLSQEGFEKAETVRALENLKVVTGFQISMRDPEFYWLAIFGEPSETAAWGWQFEGHHLALHYTLKACAISDTPTFMGAWPSEVSTMVAGGPPVGTRNLAQEEDLGRALAKALDADPTKRMQAFMSAAYRQMLPEGPDKAEPMTPAGLLGSAMSASELMQLQQIVTFYAGLMPEELATARLKRIEDHGGFQSLSFVWTGALEPQQRHFYRIQGPTFFIEYRNDDGNHIHSAWRDFDGDFGDDLP